MNNSIIVPLFAKPVYISEDEYPVDKNLLEFFCKEEMITEPNHGGNLTTNNSHLFEKKELEGLKRFCVKHLEYYAYEVLQIKKSNKFYITQSWSNINQPGTGHHKHWHTNSLISGVFYIIGEPCPIIFENANFGAFGRGNQVEYEEYNVYNTQNWWIENTQGKLVLFPSLLDHFVPENETETSRMSLSFNTWIEGKMRLEGDKTEVVFKP